MNDVVKERGDTWISGKLARDEQQVGQRKVTIHNLTRNEMQRKQEDKGTSRRRYEGMREECTLK